MTVVGGIDIGATKRHVRVVDLATGRVLADEIAGATGWSALSDADRARELERIAGEALVPRGVDVAVGGVHGADTVDQKRILSEALRRAVPRSAVVNDAELVIPAVGARSGVGVIAGTGSSVTGHTAVGDAFTVGGWGWILGDEGSATGIVRDAAKAALRVWDRAGSDALLDAMLAAFDAAHPHEIGYLLSTQPPEVWAAHARVVFEQADGGSRAARAVLDGHVDALVVHLGVAKDRGGDLSTVAAAGGVFVGQPGFFRRFADAARRKHDAIERIVLLEEPPVVGALRLAEDLTSKHEGA